MTVLFSGKARAVDCWVPSDPARLDFLVPYPRRLKTGTRTFPLPGAVRVVAEQNCQAVAEEMKRDVRCLLGLRISATAPFRIRLRLRARPARREGYTLTLTRAGAVLTGDNPAGLFYGMQTLLQLLVLGPPEALPEVSIRDWPEYRLRGLMLDMGRSVFSPALLRRTVRILARLKMNLLHLHLSDNELCGLRFRKLPFGRENPHALTLRQLRALVRYARRRHVTVVPEMELWGHARSLLYHVPHLAGTPRADGSVCDFAIGEDYFDLVGRIFDELLPTLEKNCAVNVGFDEAQWSLAASVPASRRHAYTPETLVARVYDLLQKSARKHGRRATLHLWADEHGRPIPKRIRNGRVTLIPWRYWERHPERILEKIRAYGGRGKPKFLMGAGMSPGHFGGHFGATRHWCRYGVGVPNAEGVVMALWEDNDLPGKMLGLYGGANCAWSPESPVPPESLDDDQFHERFYLETGLRMRRWQAEFRDADDEALRRDGGPYVFRGFRMWGAHAGTPVAPTVLGDGL